MNSKISTLRSLRFVAAIATLFILMIGLATLAILGSGPTPAGAQDSPTDIHLQSADTTGNRITLILNNGEKILVDLTAYEARHRELPPHGQQGACLVWSGSGPVWGVCQPRTVTGTDTGYYAYSEDRTFTAQELTGAHSASFSVDWTSAADFDSQLTTPETPTGTWTYTDSTCPADVVCGWEGLAVPTNLGRPEESGVSIVTRFDSSWHTQAGGTVTINGMEHTVLVKDVPTHLESSLERFYWPDWTGTALDDIPDPGWAPPTIYMGWSSTTTFTEAQITGYNSRGYSPRNLIIPSTTFTPSAYLGFAIPAPLTLESVEGQGAISNGYTCVSFMDCEDSTDISINGAAYKYFRTVSMQDVNLDTYTVIITWSE